MFISVPKLSLFIHLCIMTVNTEEGKKHTSNLPFSIFKGKNIFFSGNVDILTLTEAII